MFSFYDDDATSSSIMRTHQHEARLHAASDLLGHSAKMSFYSGILNAKFFDCGVSLMQASHPNVNDFGCRRPVAWFHVC